MKVTWMDSPKHKFVVHMSSSRKHRHVLQMLLAALSWNAWETYLKEFVLKLVAHHPVTLLTCSQDALGKSKVP